MAEQARRGRSTVLSGEVLEAWRRGHRWSRRALGQRWGLAQGTIYHWERAAEVPHPRLVALLMKGTDYELIEGLQGYVLNVDRLQSFRDALAKDRTWGAGRRRPARLPTEDGAPGPP